MPLGKEAFTAYQRARRLAARPCAICGEVGNATEKHKAADAAPELRCCPPCLAKITAAPAATPAPPNVVKRRYVNGVIAAALYGHPDYAHLIGRRKQGQLLLLKWNDDTAPGDRFYRPTKAGGVEVIWGATVRDVQVWAIRAKGTLIEFPELENLLEVSASQAKGKTALYQKFVDGETGYDPTLYTRRAM